MRKIIFYTLLLLSVISCNEKEVLDGVNEKTLIVYFPWSGSDSDTGLTTILQQNIKQMQSAVTSSSVLDSRRVFIFMASSTSQTNLYELVYNGGSAADLQLVKSYGSAERYSTKEGIEEIFLKVKSLAPALNYALVTGGHGCGWTPASSWESYPAKSPRKKSFGSITDLTNYGIDVTTLASAIKDADMHMQFILFDNCYMQNIETAYALKDVTNFLVGTTTEINTLGMPYASIFDQLVATAPDYASITQSFNETYSSTYGTISAVDCRQMDALASQMEQLNKQFSFSEDNRDSLQVLDGFHPALFFDFRDYTRWLTDSDSVSMCHVDSLLAIAIRSEQHTSRYFSSISPKGYHTIKCHSGLTISDPSLHPVATKSKQTTSWWNSTH